jgi:hypothetical protein
MALRNSIAFSSLVGILALAACSAEVGAPGANGAPGNNGSDGPQGEKGDKGETGDTGMIGAKGDAAPQEPILLDKDLHWYGQNREKLQALIHKLGAFDAQGKPNPGYDATKPPVAVFDWDNTMVKNDIGDEAMYFMVKKGHFLQPASWAATSPHLTSAALTALNKYCPLSTKDAPLDTTSTPNGGVGGTACADALLCTYEDGVWNGTSCTPPAFSLVAPAVSTTIEPTYAWTVSLMRGHTPEEMKSIARAAIEDVAFTTPEATQQIGMRSFPRFVRIYLQMKDLVGTMQANGFDVWMLSATAQPVVEAMAEGVGVSPDHVIGVRSVVAGGVLTEQFQGCGDQPDGNFSVISYKEGKRCWMHKVIYAQSYKADATAFKAPTPHAFAAGDSDTDIAFVKDATELKLVINRNKTELMCNAYDNYQGKWLVNPMFIQPKGKKTSDYKCSGVYKNSADANIPDQADLVYGY